MHLEARNLLRILAAKSEEYGVFKSGEIDYYRRRGDLSHHYMRPGSWIERRSPEDRELLQHLRSEDLAHEHPSTCPWIDPKRGKGRRRTAIRMPGFCPERQI